MAPKIRPNDACPCRSGKKYKRCCGGPSGPAPSAPAAVPGEDDVDAALEASLATGELTELLEWRDFDFEVDLFDPVLDDLTAYVQEMGEGGDRDELLPLELAGVQRHATPEVRARCLDELERRGAADRRERVRELSSIARTTLEDLGFPAAQVGLLLSLYHRYIFGRLLEHSDALQRGEEALDPALKKLAEDAGQTLDDGMIRALSDRLSAMEEDPLPYLEFFAGGGDFDESVGPLVAIIGRRPSMRAARLLEILIDRSVPGPLDDALFEAMARMAGLSWPILLYRARLSEADNSARLSRYEFLVRAKAWEVLDLLVDEFCDENRWEETTEDEDLADVAKLIVALDDRRAVGRLVQSIHDGEIGGDKVPILEEALGENGWWKEIDEPLAAARRGVRVLVPSDMHIHRHMRKHFKRNPADSLEGASFQANMAAEDWNRAYHEDLLWLRPCDFPPPGPRESGLMRQFMGIVEERARTLGAGANARDLQREFGRLQSDWMLAPQDALGGHVPLAVILEEKEAHPFCPAYSQHYRRRRIGELYAHAREMEERGDRSAARRMLEAILQIDPAHPFARRFLAKFR